MTQTVGFLLAGKQSRGTLWDLELLGSAAGPRLLAMDLGPAYLLLSGALFSMAPHSLASGEAFAQAPPGHPQLAPPCPAKRPPLEVILSIAGEGPQVPHLHG